MSDGPIAASAESVTGCSTRSHDAGWFSWAFVTRVRESITHGTCSEARREVFDRAVSNTGELLVERTCIIEEEDRGRTDEQIGQPVRVRRPLELIMESDGLIYPWILPARMVKVEI